MKKLLMLVVMFFPMMVSAETPSWYPQDDFVLQGTIDQINITGRSVVISDSSLVFASKLKVHSMTREFYPLSSLKVGDLVGVNAIDRPDGIRQIMEIWVLQSSNYSATSGSSNVSGKDLKKQDRISPNVTR